MDQDVALALADMRYQLGQLRSGLGAVSPDDAEQRISDAIAMVTSHEQRVARAEAVLKSLAQWARAQGWSP